MVGWVSGWINEVNECVWVCLQVGEQESEWGCVYERERGWIYN